MIVIDDIVIVDDWKFEIDRNVPKIGNSLGKGIQNEDIKISVEAKIREDYANANILANIEYEGTISEIIIKGQVIEVPEKIDGGYVINKEITENGIYTIYAKDENGNYKIAKVEVTDITEDMDIWNKQDMEEFSNKVNSGRTFEGRKVRVMNNIDLEGNEQSQWIPIGKEEKVFKGTFEGNYNKILNLYINSSEYKYCGLFGYNEGIIRDIVLENAYIYNKCNVLNMGTYTGGIVGTSKGKIINCGNENTTITAYRTAGYSGSNYPTIFCGGIVGGNQGEILNCYSKATIEAYNMYNRSQFIQAIAGGIASGNDGKISNCYNRGNIKTDGGYSVSGGIVGIMRVVSSTVENSYNTANMTTVSGIKENAGIVARNGWGDGNGTITNNWCTTATQYSFRNYTTSGYIHATTGRVSEEELKIQILKLNEHYTEDIQNEDATWKYNDGYPILKWQIELK